MGAAKIFGFLLALALGASGAARAQSPVDLAKLRADPDSVTISGISSGAFMAVQFGVAWSSVVKGVASIAGGPYYCARVSPKGSQWDFGTNIGQAIGPCMKGPPGNLSDFTGEAKALADAGRIDSLENLKSQKIYLFHGYNDEVVAPALGDLTRDFYRTYASANALFEQTAIGSGHSFVVATEGGGVKGCAANAAPYLDNCGYDQAGALLQQFYGALVPPAKTLSAAVRPFDQTPYAGTSLPTDSIGLARQGYVYVPKSCEAGGCRLHVALHGCLQNASGGAWDDGVTFLNRTGLNAWAESNGIIVLYPQTDPSSGANWQFGYPVWYQTPFNPKACWDWWGYVTYNDDYVTKKGAQIAAIKAMVDAVTKTGLPAQPAQSPFALTVADRSDTGAVLAWTAAPKAEFYRVYRRAADGAFAPIGETKALSYADSGLAQKTDHVWRVAPVAGGVEQTPSEASARTRPTPAACPEEKRGSCQLTD